MEEHLRLVSAQADAFVERRSRGEKHPVHDFLFTYYQFSPAKLKRWMPPLGVNIEVADEDVQEMPWLGTAPMQREGSVTQMGTHTMGSGLRDLARWVASLCTAITNRPPRLRCYGLHEWAMVYQQPREQVRHQGYELRLSPETLAEFVRSQTVCCSHYDAFRFFTPEARPMNVFQPVLETRLEMEQGGCLHTNMDLYKWSAKLWPWVGSSLVGECFALAFEGRDLDMRASPYDLKHLGYEPIPIETAEGRAQYELEQKALAEKAVPLRERLGKAAALIAEA
ncbi:hypothetical protein BGE01nite_04180 [Brevifollis gellanilyticus]|uniref:3-methyladenine DNA glycosylase n=2 Tax=Brevifollis gellanilyticus TaxID=748831 RepID=A0A512M301_9BACT|nr:hypothetical protein BGE01nite_04180 [Brevifollis gellanilyticus]